MFVRINPGSALPIYRQILDQIRYQIASGRLKPGDRLPSIRQLARRVTTNQNTILKVYDQLAGDGLIERRRGDGSFVSNASPVLKRSECRKRLREVLVQAAVLARLFRTPPNEVHELLDRELESIHAAESVVSETSR